MPNRRQKEQNEIGKVLNEHTTKLQDIECDIASKHGTTHHTNALKKEILDITADEIVTKEETEKLESMIHNLGLEEEYEDFLDLLEEGIDMDEFEQLRKLGYTKADFQRLLQYYKERKEGKKSEKPAELIMQESKLASLLDKLENKLNESTALLVQQDTQDMIALFLAEKDKLEEKERKELQQRLRALIIMQYLEGKQLELYEISVDEQWNIIIKTKGWQTITIPAQDITVLWEKFIKEKMKDILSDDDFQKLIEKIQESQDQQENEKKSNDQNDNDVKWSLLENFAQNL